LKARRVSYAHATTWARIYCENRNGATLQTLFSGPRFVRAGLVFRESSRLALSLSGPLLFQYQNKNFTVVCLF
jgi:hypothetical protein